MKKIRTIYCDFDGTITKNDAVNGFFDLHAGKEWLKSEQLWIDGKISSMENAITQIELLPALTEQDIDNYINTIEIDEYFTEFIQYIQSKNIDFVILSDGFDLFIKRTLEKYNLENIKYFANHIVHKENGKFTIEFPYHNNSCDISAGMCKCNQVKEKDFCYIGDGTSDLCVAKKAKHLFATKNLKNYCDNNSINHYYFKNFKDIIDILKKEFEE